MANEDTPAILEAAIKMWEESPSRRAPSPSSVMGCYRQNYFIQTGVPRTNRPDAESSISAESGKATELVLLSLIQNAGIVDVEMQTDEEREIPEDLLATLNLTGGQYDAVGTTPDGERVLIELKRKGVFQILDRHKHEDLSVADEREYMQIQAMLHALGLDRCFYLAANWDRGALTRHSKGKGPDRTVGIYTEWVTRNPISAKVIAQRGQKLQDYLQVEDVSSVPREFDVNKDWQCKAPWCGWREACLAAK